VIYTVHELNRAWLGPATHLARAGAQIFSEPQSWLSQLPGARPVAASCELFYRIGKQYEKPAFNIQHVDVRGTRVAVVERTVLSRPFCRLQRFERYSDQPKVTASLRRDPIVLVVAPLSGHHATLLRETVRTLLSGHDVYVTDWVDARMVPVAAGRFGLNDYVGYLRHFIRHIGTEHLHVMAVCQATVPAVAALSLMGAAGEAQPRSLTLLGGPVDARCNPTQVNQLATGRPMTWFEGLLDTVPPSYPGRGRRVYPGFLQHAGFIAMNPLRHVSSHLNFFHDLVRGEHDDAAEHRRFYDEYNAVLDMSGDYYLDCIRVVFKEHLLPRGRWVIGGQPVRPEAITSSLLTIEGQRDDITGLGQTRATLDLCTQVPSDQKLHLAVEGAGHYGIFSGGRWREIVYPRMAEFIALAQRRRRKATISRQ
jgi:poly(3-hydroxybutyrate) depolymerase